MKIFSHLLQITEISLKFADTNMKTVGYSQMTETCVKTRLCQTLCPPTLRLHQQRASWPVIAGRARVVTAGRGWPGSSSWAHLVPWVDFSQSWARPWGGHQQAEDSQWSVSHWLTWHLISDKHVNIHKVTLHIAAQSEEKNQVLKFHPKCYSEGMSHDSTPSCSFVTCVVVMCDIIWWLSHCQW